MSSADVGNTIQALKLLWMVLHTVLHLPHHCPPICYLLHPSTTQELVRNIDILRAKILANILPKTVVCTRSVVRSIQMVVKNEVYSLDTRNFEAINSLAVVPERSKSSAHDRWGQVDGGLARTLGPEVSSSSLSSRRSTAIRTHHHVERRNRC